MHVKEPIYPLFSSIVAPVCFGVDKITGVLHHIWIVRIRLSLHSIGNAILVIFRGFIPSKRRYSVHLNLIPIFFAATWCEHIVWNCGHSIHNRTAWWRHTLTRVKDISATCRVFHAFYILHCVITENKWNKIATLSLNYLKSRSRLAEIQDLNRHGKNILCISIF